MYLNRKIENTTFPNTIYRMIHWVLSTFKLVLGHLNGIFFSSNFVWAFSQHFVNSGQKDRAKFSNIDPCTLHSVQQDVAGFRRHLFTCFLGHTPLLQYYLLFGPHPLLQLWRTNDCTAVPPDPSHPLDIPNPLITLDIQIAVSNAVIGSL